jgi:hypothetical protein
VNFTDSLAASLVPGITAVVANSVTTPPSQRRRLSSRSLSSARTSRPSHASGCGAKERRTQWKKARGMAGQQRSAISS